MVPAPMAQGEIVHAPTIIQQDRIQQQHVEMSVEEAVPRTQEEIVQGPTIIQKERIQQQHVVIPVEVPGPMTQEEIAHAPTIIPQERIFQRQVEMMSVGAPTAAQAFCGDFGGGFPPAASRTPAPDGFLEHWESWGLDDSALAMLMEQPPEVQERVLAEFSPKPGTRDINRLIHSFVRSLRTSRFPHLQAPGAGSEQAKPQAKRASQTAGSKSKPNRRQKEQA